MIIKATVTTNCEEDPYLRVKVSNTQFWPEESSLMSSINSIYLDVGDVVMVEFDEEGGNLILGKLLSDEQKESNPVKDSPIIFQSKKEDRWIVGTLTAEQFIVTTDDGTIFTFQNNVVSIALKDGTEIKVAEDSITLKTKSGAVVNLDGTKVSIKNGSLNLATIMDSLLNSLGTTSPTTMGSPAAQNFNAAIITAINQAKNNLSNLLQ